LVFKLPISLLDGRISGRVVKFNMATHANEFCKHESSNNKTQLGYLTMWKHALLNNIAKL
jgi:hypothetical protein